jgi:hypothetical protein
MHYNPGLKHAIIVWSALAALIWIVFITSGTIYQEYTKGLLCFVVVIYLGYNASMRAKSRRRRKANKNKVTKK